MSDSLNVAVLQLPTLGMNAKRLEFYLKSITEHSAKLIVLGEYVLNHFFLELKKMPLNMIKKQSTSHLELLKRLARDYNVSFIAPLVKIEDEKIYKTIAYVSATKLDYYNQQILIDYPHWNEESFFFNELKPLKEPLIVEVDGFKIAILAGYELHFDPLWEAMDRNSVDIVVLPTASTFNSHNRWRELIKSRAFLHGVYIIRANRLGEYRDEEHSWYFYGDSMLVNPEGEVEIILEDRESMFVEKLSKSMIIEHRNSWHFTDALKKRGAL